MAEQEKASAPEQQERQQGQFAIQKVYTKDISFESPASPRIFQQQWKPVINMDLASSASAVDDSFYEVVLSVTITMSFEKETVCLVEVQQAGIFHISGLDKEVTGRMLGTVCPNILFPFAREVVADLVSRGGFPQLLLAPVNFDALYEQQKQQQQAAAGEAAEKTRH